MTAPSPDAVRLAIAARHADVLAKQYAAIEAEASAYADAYNVEAEAHRSTLDLLRESESALATQSANLAAALAEVEALKAERDRLIVSEGNIARERAQAEAEEERLAGEVATLKADLLACHKRAIAAESALDAARATAERLAALAVESCDPINTGTRDYYERISAIRTAATEAVAGLGGAKEAGFAESHAPGGGGERRPSKAWCEPLSAAGEPYYCDAQVGALSLVAFRSGPGGYLEKTWAWEVHGPHRVSMAKSERRVALAEAQLAAEDAARALLVAALAVLDGRAAP